MSIKELSGVLITVCDEVKATDPKYADFLMKFIPLVTAHNLTAISSLFTIPAFKACFQSAYGNQEPVILEQLILFLDPKMVLPYLPVPVNYPQDLPIEKRPDYLTTIGSHSETDALTATRIARDKQMHLWAFLRPLCPVLRSFPCERPRPEALAEALSEMTSESCELDLVISA